MIGLMDNEKLKIERLVFQNAQIFILPPLGVMQRNNTTMNETRRKQKR